MTFEQIIALILSLAPQGILLTQEILKLIQEISNVINGLPAELQKPVANVLAKALVTKTQSGA